MNELNPPPPSLPALPPRAANAGVAPPDLSSAAPAAKPSRATGRVTLAEVAKIAGVSHITASRALRGVRGVDPALQAKVQQAAQKLGYQPDPVARALASRHGAHIAMLVPALSNTLFVDVLEAAQSTLQAGGYQTLIGVTHYDPQQEQELLQQLLSHRPAGLIVTGLDRSRTAQQHIASSGLPCVVLMELCPDQPERYCVGFSQQAAGQRMTSHLLDQGYQRIAFAAAQLDPRTLQRMAGWQRAMAAVQRYSPHLEFMRPESSSLRLGAQMLQTILQSQPAPDAIFFCNDDLAQGALLEALRLGLKVPQDLAIAGFNDLNGSDQMVPALTTIRTPRREVGLQAAALMLDLLKKQEPPARQIDLGFSLMQRGSA